MTSPSLRTAGLLWMVGPVWYLFCEALAASAFDGYSYAGNYISDLGVPEVGVFQGRSLDSPLSAVMNAGFVGEGLLFLLGLALLAPALERGIGSVLLLVSGAAHVIGIVLVGLVPGSPGNVANGLIVIHGVGAVLAIAGGNLAAISSGRGLRVLLGRRRIGGVLGAVGLVCGVLLSFHLLLPDGVWERASVYTFLGWQAVTGLALWRCRPAPDLTGSA